MTHLENVIKVFVFAAAGFAVTILWTPVLTHYMYKYKLWRKSVRTKSPDGSATPLFYQLHKDKETNVPRLGGLLIWITTIFIAGAVWIMATATGNSFWIKANFISRSQTWLPLFTLVTASILGLFDDLLQVWEKGGYIAGGIKFRHRLSVIFLISLAGAWWFYDKLGWRDIYIPWLGETHIGIWYIPIFILTVIFLFSSSIVDGLDGLAGGVIAAIFGAYAGIAFFRGQYDIATFAAVILGALLAFLWFNIPPARFYMGESGILGLTTSIAVIAFLTDSVFVLPIIAFILVLEVLSDIMQFFWKRFFGRKLFKIAPLHHHLEALGWPSYKVTMRAWVLAIIFAIIGMAIGVVGR